MVLMLLQICLRKLRRAYIGIGRILGGATATAVLMAPAVPTSALAGLVAELTATATLAPAMPSSALAGFGATAVPPEQSDELAIEMARMATPESEPEFDEL